MSLNRYIPGHGASTAKLMIVGEAPGFHEEQSGMPFVGPAGQELNSMLRTAGISRDEVYVTNVVKIRPPDNDLSRLNELGRSVSEFLPQLFDEIKAVHPNCILALGNTAFHYLTGHKGRISDWRGSILTLQYGALPKVIPTYHPANFVERKESEAYKYSAKVYTQLDFNRAVQQSKFKDLLLPRRSLSICRSMSELLRYIQQFRNEEFVATDIEVIKSIPVCIGFAFSPSASMSVPLINPALFHGSPIGRLELAGMWQLIDEFLRGKLKKIGQNWKFDEQKLRKPCGFRTENFWLDTMVLAKTLYAELPGSLAFLTSVWTEEPFYKDEGKEYNPKKDKFDDFLLYNAKDCAVTYEVAFAMLSELKDRGLEDYFFNYRMKLHDLYLGIEERGLKIDFERRKELSKKYHAQADEIQARLNSAVGSEVNVNSPKQMADLLYSTLKLPKRYKKGHITTGEDVVVALLGNVVKDEGKKKILNDVLELRKVKKTLSTYVEARPDYDGRMRTSYMFCGTETGRSTTSVLDPPVRPEKLCVAMHTLTKHGQVGSDLRSIFIPDKDYRFVNVDLAQAEARIVALLAEDYDLLKLFSSGVDVHTKTANWIFQIEESLITKEMRFIGKETRHAGNYNVQKHTFMLTVNTDAKKAGIDIQISEYRAGKILDTFHRYSPKIRSVFHKGIQEAAQKSRTLVNPFGLQRTFFDRWDDSIWTDLYAHIPQSTVSDHLKRAMLRIVERIPDIQLLIESHDAILFQCKESEIDDYLGVVIPEMEAPIDFSKCSLPRGTLIIPAEAEVGANYKELMKYGFRRKVVCS